MYTEVICKYYPGILSKNTFDTLLLKATIVVTNHIAIKDMVSDSQER